VFVAYFVGSGLCEEADYSSRGVQPGVRVCLIVCDLDTTNSRSKPGGVGARTGEIHILKLCVS